LRQVDWDELLSNQLPRRKLTFLDKQQEEKYLVSFPLKGFQPQLPNALNYGQSILKNLSFLTLPAHGVTAFDSLPIPFLCVATELETGELRVFESGDLGDALRASSAFPSLFSPFEIDGCVYVDGGLVNNYPATLLKDRGIDIIIGVDVQDKPYDQTDINNITKILEQTSTYQNRINTKAGREVTDYLLIPEMEELGLTTFEQFDTAVRSGEAAAMVFWEDWLALAAGRNNASARTLPTTSALPVNQWAFDGNTYSSEPTLKRWMGADSARYYSLPELQNGLDRIYASKLYQSVDFRYRREDSTVNVRLREKESLHQVRLGLNYNDDFRAAILANLTMRNAVFKNDKFLIDVAIGEWPRVLAEYTIDKGIIPTLGLRFDYNRIPTSSYENGRRLNRYAFTNVAGDVFIRSILKNTYAIGGGLRLETVELNGVITESQPQNYLGSFLHYYGFLDFDSFDRSFYPTKGFKFNGDIRGISKHSNLSNFQDPITVVHANLLGTVPLFPRAGLLTQLQTGLTFGPNPEIPYFNYLGSQGEKYPHFITPFLGYNFMEIQTRSYLSGRVDFFWEPWKNHIFSAKYNVAVIDLDPTTPANNNSLRDGMAVSYGYNSPLGPLEFIVSGNTARRGALTYIRLGFWF
jgi:NTE family protein